MFRRIKATCSKSPPKQRLSEARRRSVNEHMQQRGDLLTIMGEADEFDSQIAILPILVTEQCSRSMAVIDEIVLISDYRSKGRSLRGERPYAALRTCKSR